MELVENWYKKMNGEFCASCFRSQMEFPWGVSPRFEIPIRRFSPSCPNCQFFECTLKGYSETQRQLFEAIHCDWVSASRLGHLVKSSMIFREFTLTPTVRDEVLDFTSPNAFRLCVVARRANDHWRASDQPPRFDMRSLSKTIDYSAIRPLIAKCHDEHVDACGNGMKRWTQPPEHFHLIHCESRRVIPVHGPCEYVALSYVWGKPGGRVAEPAAAQPAFPPTITAFPPTIEDAITVTVQLGFSYLWVDRYCIDQGNETHKASQIQQMGHIYNRASLTIIAAAGTDPSYGLPGVSRARTCPSTTAVINSSQYVPAPANPTLQARGSVWAKRGWTYQEAFLSRRRLFFTDAQSLFECGRNICEEIAFSKGWHQSGYRESVLRRERVSTPVQSLESMVQSICDYSSRELGFVQDRLRAFLGILASFALGPTPIYHLWGVPLGSDYREWRLYLAAWESTPSDRNPEFPSWSWLGWTGRLSPGPNWDYLHLGPLPSVRVEENGQAVRLSPTLLHRYYSVENNPDAAPAALQVEGATFPVYAVASKQVPIHKLHIHINSDEMPDMTMTSHWACWQDQGNRWVYGAMKVLDRSFIGGLDENGKTELLGVTIVDGVDYRKCSILRAVDGGYEAVVSIVLGGMRQLLFVELAEGESPSDNNCLYWPQTTQKRVRWL